ncbi:MAG: DUF3786 domain-containing protein [Eubacteriales bacterium]|nr:DUF3786 domain-containing protein [Eubacteriales bacterium]
MADNTNNRAFQNMRQDALHMLEGKQPELIAKRAGVIYDAEKQEFLVPSLGKKYRFSFPGYEESEEMDTWHHLSVLHYLNLADGTPAAESPCSFGELPDGLVRGGKFDRTAAEALGRFLSRHTEAEVRARVLELGGEIIDGKADLSVRLPYLPQYPVFINIWFADEEFPASARMLVDKNSWHNFTIEDAVTVGEYILRVLEVEK